MCETLLCSEGLLLLEGGRYVHFVLAFLDKTSIGVPSSVVIIIMVIIIIIIIIIIITTTTTTTTIIIIIRIIKIIIRIILYFSIALIPNCLRALCIRHNRHPFGGGDLK